MDLLKKVEAESRTLYDEYVVKLKFNDICLGQVAEKLESRMAKVDALVRKGKMPEEVAESIRNENVERYRDAEVARTLGEQPEVNGAESAEKQMTCVFWRDSAGLYLESRVVKSALRDCFSQLGIFVKKRGSKGTHNLGLYVEPDRIHYTRDGETLHDADGFKVAPVHISDASGKRSALTRLEYIEGAEMDFTIKLLRGGKLSGANVAKALALLQDAGLSGKRSQGYGKLKITALEGPDKKKTE